MGNKMKNIFTAFLLILSSAVSNHTFAYDVKDGLRALEKLSAGESTKLEASSELNQNAATTSQTKKHPRECLYKINYYPYSSGEDKFGRLTTEKIIKDAEKMRDKVCRQIFALESRETRKSQQEYFPEHCVVNTASEHNKNGRDMSVSLIESCKASLTGQDIVQNNSRLAELYAQISDKESLALASIEKTRLADQQVRSIEKFSIKNIELGISKNDLVKSNTGKHWGCSGLDPTTNQETCDLNFVSSTVKECEPVTYRTAYGNFSSEKCKNNVNFIDTNKLPIEIRNLSTLGGENVFSIQSNFYKEKLYEIKFYVSVNSELFKAITNKYGPANKNLFSWVGAREELGFPKGYLHLKDNTVLAEIEQINKVKAELESSKAQAKIEEISQKKIKDF